MAGTVIALDLAIYAQHVLMHHVPALWRLHRVHHGDPVLDTSTGLRFHPLETLLSAAFKVSFVLVLGASAVAVVTFEILLNVSSMFNHANVRLPVGVDALLRLVLVTPDMHRVHHSLAPAELSRNFGFALPWWDWLCGTYQAQPAAGHETMAIGLRSIAPARGRQLGAMLVEPFRAAADEPGVRAS
jgi:sterol desaturase/sphingolipid hydroxylase (fatty acid hydroxylase superfamily)